MMDLSDERRKVLLALLFEVNLVLEWLDERGIPFPELEAAETSVRRVLGLSAVPIRGVPK